MAVSSSRPGGPEARSAAGQGCMRGSVRVKPRQRRQPRTRPARALIRQSAVCTGLRRCARRPHHRLIYYKFCLATSPHPGKKEKGPQGGLAVRQSVWTNAPRRAASAGQASYTYWPVARTQRHAHAHRGTRELAFELVVPHSAGPRRIAGIEKWGSASWSAKSDERAVTAAWRPPTYAMCPNLERRQTD